MEKSKAAIIKLLQKVDIKLNGDRPWDLQVRDDRLWARVLRNGTLGLGEAYMDGWWDTERLDEFLARALSINLREVIVRNIMTAVRLAPAIIFNTQRRARAFQIGERHYDMGNDFYRRMLDKRMTYTCGYWKDANTLDEAQDAKLDMICKKIGLKKGQRVLDIGGGWGSFAGYAAEKYGAHVVAITVSKEQVALGRKLTAGLSVEMRLQDYRDVKERFDHVVSIGMFEHVGVKNYKTYFDVVRRVLHKDGLFLLHTIGANWSVHTTDPWIQKYIFPNSMLPSIKQIGAAIEKKFIMEDLHNFGIDYDKTLLAWWRNVRVHWSECSGAYDERFKRMWEFFLLSSAAMFRTRRIQLWQIVLSPGGGAHGYTSVRP